MPCRGRAANQAGSKRRLGKESGPGSQGMLGMLLSLLVAEKSGFQPGDNADQSVIKEFGDRIGLDLPVLLAGATRRPRRGDPVIGTRSAR